MSTFGFRAGRVARDLCLVCAQAAGFAALSYALLTSTGGGPWTALADYVGNRKVRQRLESRRRGPGTDAASADPPEEASPGEDGSPVTPAGRRRDLLLLLRRRRRRRRRRRLGGERGEPAAVARVQGGGIRR